MSFPTPKKITQDHCPSCDAESSMVEVEKQHCNGNWNEVVGYRCGLKLHYSPNYDSIQTLSACGMTAGAKIEAQRQNLIRFLKYESKLDQLSLTALEEIMGLYNKYA